MKSRSVRMLAIALCIVFLSMIFSSAVQSSFGKVEVSELRLVDDAGYEVSVQLYKPKSATPENKAPAVITIEGWFNNKEMQDANFVELARRGYVVLAADMPSHGGSDIGSSAGDMMNSTYEAVMFLCNINYVDNTKIGVTGHSFGSFSCNFAAQADNMNDPQHIAAVLVNSGRRHLELADHPII